jgi:photosystem II stability/assembly factor-like uncharacterized protein
MIKKILIFLSLLFSITVYGNSSWEQVTKASYGFLSDVFFLNNNLGWVVGNNGTILRTVDGGHTWLEPANPLPVEVSMYSVYFVNENVGYAGGTHDLILKTIDGGANWSVVSFTSVNGSIRAIYFADENKGWVLSSTSGGGQISYTTNGGANWVAQATETSVNLKAMSFSSSGHGVCVGGRSGGFAFYYTTDGLAWTKAPIPTGIPAVYSRTDIYGVGMANDNVACATGWGSSAAGLQPTFTLRTTDGGANWTYSTQAEEDRLYVNMYDIAFKDELTGIAVGGSVYKGGVAYKTVDGGVTWKEVYLPVGFAGKAISFVNNKICIVGGGGGIVLSEDNGETWELIPSVVNSTLYDIDLLSSGTIVAAGFYGAVLKSVDKGFTWTSSYVSDKNVCSTIRDIYFLDENIGYTAKTNRIVSKTTHGGNTWKQIMPDTSVSGYANWGVQFIDENVGFVVGANGDAGVFYKTVNGGESWSLNNSSFGTLLKGLHFFDKNNGVVVGEGSVVAYTSNGGADWTAATLNNMPSGKYDFEMVEFLNNNFGLAAGEQLIKTVDGGKTWEYIAVADLSKKIKGIAIVNESIWYLAGDKYLLVTEDGGINWRDVVDLSIVTARQTYDVMVDSKGYTWLACGASEIYKGVPTVDVKLVDSNLPNKFILKANYPNPFNPSTKIKYSIPVINSLSSSNVTLKVYNLLGEEVATLVNEAQQSGTYEVEFNASKLTSGVYIYKLQNAGFSQSRKMLLIK